MKKLLAILLVLTTIALCACTSKPVTPTDPRTPTETPTEKPTEGFSFNVDNYPKMGGSLACLPLGQAITATQLGISRDDADKLITFEGSTTDNYRWLLDGTFDIILAYEPSAEAWDMINADENGVEMKAIGADALVFIGNKDNPVTSLSFDDISGIYSGKIKNWSELGGKDEEILPFQRNRDSGSQTLFDKLINLGDELMEPPSEFMVGTMIGLLQAVADYNGSDGALGYTVYYYLTQMESGTLDSAKIFDYEGVTPSNETISSGEYKLANDFYVVIRKDASQDSPERILYNWICSEEGKALVEHENYASK